MPRAGRSSPAPSPPAARGDGSCTAGGTRGGGRPPEPPCLRLGKGTPEGARPPPVAASVLAVRSHAGGGRVSTPPPGGGREGGGCVSCRSSTPPPLPPPPPLAPSPHRIGGWPHSRGTGWLRYDGAPAVPSMGDGTVIGDGSGKGEGSGMYRGAWREGAASTAPGAAAPVAAEGGDTDDDGGVWRLLFPLPPGS